LFGHILAVVAWVGANIVVQFLILRARSLGGEREVQLLGDVEWLAPRYFIPISLIVVVFGFLLIHESKGAYDLGDTWVSVGLGGFLFSFIVGAGFLGPESGRIKALAEANGPEDEAVGRRVRRVHWVARIELLVLILVILDMVAKPGL
jgi:uncharacterized membrane protein